MRTIISRWFLFGLLLGWALTHATVFGQGGKTPETKPAAVDKIRQGLDKSITIDYTGQTLAEALNHFREKTAVPINIDPAALAPQMPIPFNPNGAEPAAQVTLKGTNEKASQILRRTLSAHRLAFIIIDDAVLVTSEETAVARQMRQRVSIDLDEVPLKKAVRDLARSHGINLVIDPKVAKQADAPVSLQLESTSIETTLRLLAELSSLKAVRMGNVVFITSEEKAKKIYAEEKHQFDNPLNPSNPGGLFPPVMNFGLGGGFGGFGGGGVIPAVPIQKIMVAPVQPPVAVEPVAPPLIKKGNAGAPLPPPPPLPPGVQRPEVAPPVPPVPPGPR